MKHVDTSPVLLRARRTVASPADPARPKDLRWYALDLVRTCRAQLKLRDRDIATLRGLLSLLPADAPAHRMVVFASNRVLGERCDGIDERTLRRRLAHLASCGLIARRSSPNGKRYQVKNADAELLVAYGFDLSPLFALLPDLEALANECRREQIRVRALRSLIRDFLFRHPDFHNENLREEARLSLRRNLSSDALQTLLVELEAHTLGSCAVHDDASNFAQASDLTASSSQIDRHIQSSDKEEYDSERCEEQQGRSESDAARPDPSMADSDITITECLELASTACAMSRERPRSWGEVIELAATLAPAIGIGRDALNKARRALGDHGCALAILGLVQAYDRIRNAEGYLISLSQRMGAHGFNLVRMFRSLAKSKSKPSSAAFC